MKDKLTNEHAFNLLESAKAIIRFMDSPAGKLKTTIMETYKETGQFITVDNGNELTVDSLYMDDLTFEEFCKMNYVHKKDNKKKFRRFKRIKGGS